MSYKLGVTRCLSLILLMICLLAGCTQTELKEPRPPRTPANNEKPDLITADRHFRKEQDTK